MSIYIYREREGYGFIIIYNKPCVYTSPPGMYQCIPCIFHVFYYPIIHVCFLCILFQNLCNIRQPRLADIYV